jgi:hypothetical protein
MEIRNHVIDSKPERSIGIEISEPFEVTPIRLGKKKCTKIYRDFRKDNQGIITALRASAKSRRAL